MSSRLEASRAFIEMAHQIVWCTAASVDTAGRPRSRVVHPIWELDGGSLVGWFGTVATKTKRAHLESSPYLSMNYWGPSQDTCVAECKAQWCFDMETRETVWQKLLEAPAPLGYDPRIIDGWESPASETFSVLRLEPWRLRVFPGSLLMGQGGAVSIWEDEASS